MGQQRPNKYEGGWSVSGEAQYLRPMVVFPHAKVNLGLNVLRKRPDGFHDIESVMVPIPLYDVLEAVVDPDLSAVIYTRSGLEIPGSSASDLCMRAVEMIRSIRALPGLRLHLHKIIPMGAGLGGGSSDGAFTLLLLNNLLDLGLSPAELHEMAAELGSDCAFFLKDGPQLALGRGEELRSIDLNLSGLHMILVNPGIHVATPEVYRNTIPTEVSWDLGRKLIRELAPSWQGHLLNTMEPYVFEKHPEIAQIKTALLDAGALYASMSGSGSSVFGLFEHLPKKIELSGSSDQWVLSLKVTRENPSLIV